MATEMGMTGRRGGHLYMEHRWHEGPVDGPVVLGPSTATPSSPLLPPPAQIRVAGLLVAAGALVFAATLTRVLHHLLPCAGRVVTAAPRAGAA